MEKVDAHEEAGAVTGADLSREVCSADATGPLNLTPVSAAASGKAIIVGEHAVVYGARAVAMPVPSMQMTVRLTPTGRLSSDGQPVVRVLLGGRAVTAHLRGVVDDAFQALNLTPESLDLEGHSSVLIGAGVGSSASLCVVVLKALAAAAGRQLSAKDLATYANKLEARFHGNPSGLDTSVVAFGRVISFAKGTEPIDIPVLRPRSPAGGGWHFALLDSGARSSTLAMIQAAAPFFRGQTGARRLALFDQIAAEVAQGLSDGDAADVASAMQEAGALLTESGIVNAPLAELVEQALSVGCLAAKPTGAGGGGCVLALLDPGRASEQMLILRQRLEGRVFPVELS